MVVALLVLSALGGGCVQSPTPVGGKVQGAEQEDFWVPPSFDLVRSEEYTQVAGLRSWDAKYRGRESIQAIEPRYVEEMPELGWRLQEIRRVGTSGDKILTFYKGDEQTVLRLSREFDGSFGGFATAIEARIGPRPVETFDVEAELSALRQGGLRASPDRRIEVPSPSENPSYNGTSIGDAAESSSPDEDGDVRPASRSEPASRAVVAGAADS